MVLQKDESKFWHNNTVDVRLMHAYHVTYGYPRHSHDHYVISLIESGLQSFTLKGTKYLTPPSGLILINPSVVHTGEAATARGFRVWSLYPTEAHLQTAVSQLTDRPQHTPYFRDVRVDDAELTQQVRLLHARLTNGEDELATQSCFIALLAKLIERYGEMGWQKRPLGNERHAVQKARRYIEDHFAERIQLDELAAHVALSPYHLLRVFHAEVGLPPHAYLQDVRIRRAQQLIEEKRPLADVALAVGFSHQSHLTRRFKQIVGLTPGQYATQLRS